MSILIIQDVANNFVSYDLVTLCIDFGVDLIEKTLPSLRKINENYNLYQLTQRE